MAVPPNTTTLNLSGKYFQNKTLSDDTDEILRLQGVSWFTRRIIKYATLYLTINHRTEEGIEKITVEQVLSGGAGSSTDDRILDWEERPVDDQLFGPMLTKTRRLNLEDIEKDWLKNGWADTTKEHGTINTYGQSDTAKSGRTWVADVTWGIEEIEGEMRYARHVFFVGPGGEEIQARLVYDYQGPLD
ncbi:hypothetical protein EW026_g3797 [Hermanssonia centrifuga]|uniref:Uncharacterized protein n=1 Tax=Hermanssonia centrifuga TaxID=98765 RepID=A0A4S4KJ26_9APHY|nr:hypothetical protein EW026_g3797 [Hermanssonia centrifuga]